MAKTTGPILAIGGITMASQVLIDKKPPDWRVPVATAVAAGLFALAEKGWPEGAILLSYTALVTILFVRVDPKTPAPAERFNTVLNAGTGLLTGKK
jgi:Na+-translocating ferredoxin:NAD+ oxidoreductase RnfD subunit